VGETIRIAAEYVAYVLEAIAGIVIVIGSATAFWHYLTRALPKRCHHTEMIRSRIKLGNSLSLALEFLIGADILKTALTPSWESLGILAGIVGLRTVLNYFLMRELAHEEHAIQEHCGAVD
jgi:uncharacterized membrane protein